MDFMEAVIGPRASFTLGCLASEFKASLRVMATPFLREEELACAAVLFGTALRGGLKIRGDKSPGMRQRLSEK